MSEFLIWQRPDRTAFFTKVFANTEANGERVIGTSFHETDAEYICMAITFYERDQHGK